MKNVTHIISTVPPKEGPKKDIKKNKEK